MNRGRKDERKFVIILATLGILIVFTGIVVGFMIDGFVGFIVSALGLAILGIADFTYHQMR